MADDMDVDVEFAFLILLLGCSAYLFAKRRVRRFGVRPLNRQRQQKGMFANLLTQMILKKDHQLFFKYTRMTPKMFFYLLSLVQHRLEKDKRRKAIEPAHRLILTLHYLSSGCSMQEIAYGHYLGLTTVSLIIRETTKVLWDILCPIFLKPPTQEDYKRIAHQYFMRWNLPNCVGAVDGKHVNIQAPFNAGSEFFNYKKQHSLVLMAACEAYYKFTLVDIGAAGGNHDSVVFSESAFGKQLLAKQLDLPPLKALPNSATVLPHFFVGDAAFPLHYHLLRPYPGKDLSQDKRIFNYRLSRARRTIENAFGILVQRWRILRNNIIADLDTCQNITMACVVLHNFIQKEEEELEEHQRRYVPTGFVDVEQRNGVVIPGLWRQGRQLRRVNRVGANNAANVAMQNRSKLLEYLNSPEGSVPWQEEYILAGSVPNHFGT